jgi:hypothetical protein
MLELKCDFFELGCVNGEYVLELPKFLVELR